MSKFKHFSDKDKPTSTIDFVPLTCYRKDFNFIIFAFAVIVLVSIQNLYSVYYHINTLKDRINKIEQKVPQGELTLTSTDPFVQ